MTVKVKASTREGAEHMMPLVDFPNECPVCHAGIHPQFLVASAYVESVPHRLEAVFRCGKSACQALFVAYYVRPNGLIELELGRTEPQRPAKAAFGPEIATLSPMFVDIYNQSVAAESYRLDQIAGTGFRKALEFLVKDFAIAERPTEKGEIVKKFLGPCIRDYIDDTRLKATAERAAWLGNDETHYSRKWEGKDLEDLKQLVKLTVNWVENVLLTAHYQKDMPQSS